MAPLPLLLAAIAVAIAALAPGVDALADEQRQQPRAAAATAAPNGVFLPTLPLTPVAATPANLLSDTSSGSPLSLDSQTTFTAVFSRPVIALGSDFGLDADAPLPESLSPFFVDCPVPGRTRWVTTSIARWDPLVSWPPDLDCELRWNKNLRSFDGAPLVLPPGAPESFRISTPGLTMTLETVRSSFLNKITGDYWNTFAGMKEGAGSNPFQPADKTPEIPPDGNLTFSFSYPVSLASLADGAIKVEPCCGYDVPGGKKEYAATWASCDDASRDDDGPLPFYGGNGGLSSSSSSPSAHKNTTCAVLKIFPAIPNNGTALIRLPKGAIYNPAAGAARDETKIYVHGLRPFRLPLRQDFAQLNETSVIQQGSTNWGLINYRRLLMWLPHGLAPTNDDAQTSLLPLISICKFEKPYDWASPCKDLEKKGWTLARTKPGQVVLSVPQLEPRQHYKIRVDASDAVKDGYGQPLQFSQAFFFTNELYPAFQGPQLASSPVLAVLEADGGATASADDLPPPGGASSSSRPSSRLFGRRGGAGAGADNDNDDAGPWQPLLPLSAKRAPWNLVARGNTSAPPKDFLAWRLDDSSAAGVSRVLSIATNYMPVTPAMIGSVADSGGGGRRSGGGGRDAAPSSSSLTTPYTPYFNASRPAGSQVDPAFLPFSLASPLEGASAQFLGFCCDVSAGNGPGNEPPPASLTNKALVLQSRLQAAVIKTDRRLTVWVTDTRARPGGAGADGSTTSSSSAAPPSPVPNAKVSIFEQNAPWDRVRARLPIANATCTTDNRGICSVEMPPNTYGALMAVIEPPSVKAGGGRSLGGAGGPLIVPNADAYSSLPAANEPKSKEKKTTLLAAMVIDRELVRAGGLDPLRVTAYLQRQDGVALSAPASPLSTFIVVDPSPDPAQAARGEVYRAPATFDPVYGSVHASVLVPAGAEPRRYNVFVAVPKTSGFQSNSEADGGSRYVGNTGAEDLSLLAQASFTAADPRLPTASLTMVAPDWSPPGKDFPVLLRAESFVGSSVANATFTLDWRVNSPTTQTPASGSIDVTTDALGRARVIIPAGPSLIKGINATLAGDTIDLSAVWIGPTRERVEADDQVVVAEGPVKVALARSPVTDVPGIPFGVTARAFASNRESTPLDLPSLGGEDDDGDNGVEVEISLAAAELPPGATAATGGVAAARRAAAELAVSQGFDAKRAFDLAADPLAGCSSEQRAKLKAQKCRVVSGRGDFSQCQLTLPCSGDLVLKACAIAFANGTAVPGKPCYTAPIGRNASSWASAPWQHQPLLRVEPEQQRYKRGDTPRLAFFNPYYGLPASAVVVYGNQVAKKTKYFASVPPGPNALALDPIGDECTGGCRVTLALAVPRPPPGEASSAAAVPQIVPRSVVFDPLAPHIETAELTLSAPYPNLANVSIAIVGQGVDYDPSPAEQDEELLALGGLDPKDAAALALPLFNTSLLPGGRINAPKPDAPAPESDPNAPIPVVRPSSKTAMVRVSVVDAATGLPAPNAEVTVMAVDKAVLALLPVDLRLPGATELKPTLRGDHRTFSANDARANAAAVDAVFSALRRRMRLDPFLPVDTTVTPSSALFYGGWPSSVSYPLPGAADQPDQVYLARFRTAATVTPRYDWSELARYGAGATGGGAAAASLRFGKNFRMTPLFAVVKTNAQGVATVAFPAPENTGAFLVRAYAATDAPRLVATRNPPPPSRAPTKYGAAGTELIVRLPITLTPSVPRLVRVGDAFEAGVVVAAPLVRTQRSGGKAEVEVTARLVGEIRADNSSSTAAAVLELIGGGGGEDGASSTKTVRLSRADQQEEVRFSWSAGAIGRARVVFSARVVGGDEGDADALEQEIEVQGKQAPVFVATSFALSGGGARAEGLALPAADPGAGGSLDLVAGVGSLPAIQASFGQLLTQGKLMRGEDDDEDEDEDEGAVGANSAAKAAGARNATAASSTGSDADSGEVLAAYLAVATASLPAFMASYSSGASRSSFLPPASVEVSARAARDAAGPLTVKPDSGLVYSPPPSTTDAWGGRDIPRADAWLNSWGTWVVEQAALAAGGSGNGTATALPPPLAADFAKMRLAAESQWKPAVATAIVRDAEEARSRGYTYSDWSTLSWARLVLGADWSPPSDAAGQLAMPRLVEAALAGNASAGAVARTALALEASGGGGDKEDSAAASAKLRERLLSSLRATGRTAYLSNAPGAAGAAPLEAQAFALLLLSSPAPNENKNGSSITNPLVQKLAAYVAQGGSSLSSGYGALCVSVSGADAAVAAAALAAYDARRGSTDPDLRVSVVATGGGGSGGAPSRATLLEAEFTPANAGAIASSSTPWADLPARNASLSFNTQGRGEASVAAGLSFTPAQLMPFPTYRGIYVERIIQQESGEGPALRAVPLATVVTVSVQITTPDDLQGVIVDVWMPGGLEPLDPNVYSDASAQIACGAGNGGGGGWASSPSPRWYGWWLCPKSSVLPSSVRLSYSYLPAGARTVKLKAIAATAGEFVLPPTKAYVSAQPEVMGLSAAGKLIVCDLGPAAARRAAGTGERSCGPGSEVGAVEAPRACPAPAGGKGLACSGNGACDLSRGTCVCQAGFSGKACEVAVAVAAA